MRGFLLILLLLLSGCAPPPLEISEKLTHQSPEKFKLTSPAPETLTLDWAPEPIENFTISQNADGITGSNNYQEFAIGQLISERVEDYLGSVTELITDSDKRVLLRIEGARINYKYVWEQLEYVKLMVNIEMTIDGQSARKVYYRQIADQPAMTPKSMLHSVFDGVSIEMGQDILKALAN